MFKNWQIVRRSLEVRVEVENLSEEDAKWIVDRSGEALYAVDPNGKTYPTDLHDDGDVDPAFN